MESHSSYFYGGLSSAAALKIHAETFWGTGCGMHEMQIVVVPDVDFGIGYVRKPVLDLVCVNEA